MRTGKLRVWSLVILALLVLVLVVATFAARAEIICNPWSGVPCGSVVLNSSDVYRPSPGDRVAGSWLCPPVPGATETTCAIFVYVGRLDPNDPAPANDPPQTIGTCLYGFPSDVALNFDSGGYWHGCVVGPLAPEYGATCASVGSQGTRWNWGGGGCGGGVYEVVPETGEPMRVLRLATHRSRARVQRLHVPRRVRVRAGG